MSRSDHVFDQNPPAETVSAGVSYADAGVDLEAAEASVPMVGRHVERTRRPEVLSAIGGFGGLFAFDPSAWRDPVLVSGTDGVGTKVDLARRTGVLDTVGIDLVAMVVDDLVVTGAEPLFFNDYLSVGRLDPDRVAALVAGIADGCVQANCALVGGETAEHPGLLDDDEFDLAGFGVGVVERDAILGPDRVVEGDVLVAMSSSGLHSNGYSLVRRIIDGLDLDATHGLGAPLGEVLLTPTRIHVPAVLDLLGADLDVHALCHVTGGGLVGNVPRVLPDGLGATVDADSWTRPDVFQWLAERGPVLPDEMWRTFNNGVGMVAVVAADAAAAVVEQLAAGGTNAWPLGVVESHVGGPRVRVTGAF